MRNYAVLALAVAGVFILIDVSWSDDLWGLVFAVVNALLFMTYIVLGHRISEQGAEEGISSSVVPYVCDQLAMSQLPRNTYALLSALLPATATIIGAVILGQIPTLRDIFGILLVMSGVAIHKPAV